MKTWWDYGVHRVVVGNSESIWWLDHGDIPQGSVLGTSRDGYFGTWLTQCNLTLHSLFLGPWVFGWLDSQDGFLWIVPRFTTRFQMGCEWKLCLADNDTGSS